MDLKDMSAEQLRALEDQICDERRARQCGEFLSGQQGCDQGVKPHDEHGYTRWRDDGKGQVRVTWKDIGVPETSTAGSAER